MFSEAHSKSKNTRAICSSLRFLSTNYPPRPTLWDCWEMFLQPVSKTRKTPTESLKWVPLEAAGQILQKFIQNEGCVGYSVLMLFSHLVIPSSWYIDRVSKIVSSRTLEPWEGSREVLHSQFTGHGFSEGCVSACLEKIFLVLLLFRACKYPKHRQFPPRN